MRAGVPSRTAYGVAVHRTAHQILDRPLIFEDPIAARIVSGGAAPGLPGTVAMRSTAQGQRLFVAVRSRYAEDELARFVVQGVRQYIVLGAGLDTFAYRNPYSPRVKVFEVDHPDTQAWKKERLRAAGLEIPASVSFVPVDFEIQRLATVLESVPFFDREARSFFSMLGVTPYLTSEALLETLRAVPVMPPGSGIVFDYAVTSGSLNLRDKIALKILAERVAGAGEPFQLFLEPGTLARKVHEMGFTAWEDLGVHEINARYFRDRADGSRIRSAIGRLACATL